MSDIAAYEQQKVHLTYHLSNDPKSVIVTIKSDTHKGVPIPWNVPGQSKFDMLAFSIFTKP